MGCRGGGLQGSGGDFIPSSGGLSTSASDLHGRMDHSRGRSSDSAAGKAAFQVCGHNIA